MRRHLTFAAALLRHSFHGGRDDLLFLTLLALGMLTGVLAYGEQAREGLAVTGMNDQVLWGLYIGNFVFLVGVAATAVVLVVPAYVFQRREMRRVVLLGECMAITAVIMSLLFVTVDLGQPLRFWHALPFLGRLNFPTSILAWDMVVLAAYLLLNIGLVYTLLLSRFEGRILPIRRYYPFLIFGIFLGLGIHTVTAFMLSGNPARPFWNTAILAPRFIASAFAAGSGLMILAFQVLHRVTPFRLSKGVVRMLALIMAFSILINLFLLCAELFHHFYRPTAHGTSARYLYFGLEGASGLRGWIWLALLLNLAAAVILTVHRLRNDLRLLNTACVMAFVGIWFEKGLGLVVPGFIPTPLGEVVEYSATAVEIQVTVGIWSFGVLLFTILARGVVAVETGRLRGGAGGAGDAGSP